MSMWRTPRCDRASTTAFGRPVWNRWCPTHQCLGPEGLSGLSVSVLEASKLGNSLAAGLCSRFRLAVSGFPSSSYWTTRTALAPPLGDSSMLLTPNEERVEDAPAVVHRNVASHRHLARLGVHFDHRDVRPEGKVEFEPSKSPSVAEGQAQDRLAGGWRRARRLRALPMTRFGRVRRPREVLRLRRRHRRGWPPAHGGNLLGPDQHRFGGSHHGVCPPSARIASPWCPDRGARRPCRHDESYLVHRDAQHLARHMANAVWWPWP